MKDEFGDREVVRRQEGVITRRQAFEAGMTSKAVAVRLRTGRWQQLYPGVYATFSGPVPRGAALWAAVLRAGPAAVLSHQTAAELYGLLDAPAPLIHVTVPSGSRVVCPTGMVVHYSGRLEQAAHPALAPPRTRLEECVLDLAESAASLDDGIGVILRAIGHRQTTAGRVRAAMDARPKLRWRRDLACALEVAAEGAHSLLEYRYVTRVERPHGLPRGKRQRRVVRDGRSQYQDVAYEEHLLVVELDGQAAHPLESKRADTWRDNLNAADGLATIRLGYLDVSQRSCQSAALIGQALRRRGWGGQLRRCGAGCQAAM